MTLMLEIRAWPKDRIARRIAAVASEEWPARRLLSLVEAVCSGGLDRASRDLRITSAEALRLWDLLYPAGYRGVTNQEALLRGLRQAVAMEDDHA